MGVIREAAAAALLMWTCSCLSATDGTSSDGDGGPGGSQDGDPGDSGDGGSFDPVYYPCPG